MTTKILLPFIRTFSFVLALLVVQGYTLAQAELADLLQARLQHTARYAWSMSGQELRRAPLDWTKIPGDKLDPLEDAHKQGISAFANVKGKEWKGEARYDISDGKCKYEFELAGQKYGSYSDGKSIATNTPTSTRDGAAPGLVEIGSKENVGRILDLAMFCVGFDFVPSRIPQIHKCLGSTEDSIALDEFIQLLKDPKIEKTYSTKDKRISVGFTAFISSPEGDYAGGQVVYEFASDGALEQVSWNAGKGWSPSLTISYKNATSSIGIRAPSQVEFVDWTSGIGRRINFKGWKKPTDAEFEFEIPKGAIVNDHINRLSYTNSGNAKSESRAAHLYALQHDLRLANPDNKLSFKKIAIVGFTLVVLSFAFLRRWKHGRFLIVALAVFPSLGCRDNSTVVADIVQVSDDKAGIWQEGVGWNLKVTGNNTVYVSQCGTSAAFLALELAGRQYNPLLVARSLQPSLAGIKMSDIKTLLVSHGIEVSSRKNLSMWDVVSLCKSFEFAVVHIPQYQRGQFLEPHYVVVYRRGDGEVMFLDHPLKPIPISKDRSETSDLVGLTALLCKRNAKPNTDWQSTTQSIVVTPEKFVDGFLKEDVVLHNSGNAPIAIVEGKASCSCVQLDFTPQIVYPHKSIKYPIVLDKLKWGSSKQELEFVDAVGSRTRVSIEGSSFEGQNSPTEDQGTSTPFGITKTLFIPQNCGNSTYDMQLSIPILDAVPDGCSVHCDQDSCSASVEEASYRQALKGKIHLASDELRDLSLGSPIRKVFRVTKDNMPIGDVNVNIQRANQCEYSVSFAEQRFAIDIHLTEAEGWSLSDVSVDKFDKSEVEVLGTGHWRVSIGAPVELDSGTYIAKATFGHPDHHSFCKLIMLMQ